MDLLTIERTISYIFQIYTYVVIAYILLSWLPNARESVVGQWLAKLVEPYLAPFRKLIPPIGGILDLSPIVALFALTFIKFGVIAIIEFFVVGL